MKKIGKKLLYLLSALALLYALLLIPDSELATSQPVSDQSPFVWNKDAQWQQLETMFREARQLDSSRLDSMVSALQQRCETGYQYLSAVNSSAGDSTWNKSLNDFFILASQVAVQQDKIPRLLDHYNRMRKLVKDRSQDWDMQETQVRQTVYTQLYGMRAAVEEVLLQADSINFPSNMLVSDERSATPTASIFGIEVHSGDLLVSRGGAEVSALISRGNNYPGNFSHIALIYVDDVTNEPFLIEAHIEKGVAVATVAQYEADKKLRFMVMRPRADLPVMIADPLLPQKAAMHMFAITARRHIPYDFKMDFNDTTEMFCSEVASYAYRNKGLQVWKYPSVISSPGVVNWLSDFGVEHFVTQMPSDLEYDPQLSIVAEWRDPETLYKDHIDNAVMDALLEKADKGVKIGYNTWQLPFVRVLKGYCMLKNLFGKTGMIPEGMSATRALKNQTFVALHSQVKNKTMELAAGFTKQNGYRPPYWQLLNFSRLAADEML